MGKQNVFKTSIVGAPHYHIPVHCVTSEGLPGLPGLPQFEMPVVRAEKYAGI